MDERQRNSSQWTLHGTVAELSARQLSARIDVARPDLGLQHLKLNGHELPGHLLAVGRHGKSVQAAADWPLPLADVYVRGADLVATYCSTDEWPFSPQLYWTAADVDDVDSLFGSLSLLVSVQTHLLDTWPEITVTSQLTLQEVLKLNRESGVTDALRSGDAFPPSTSASCALYRLADLPVSYVEVMPPNDFRELQIHSSGSGGRRLEWHLFADFLEKGVIRRARLQCAFVPRADDVQNALTCCAAMQRRPLPLTT